MEVSENGEITHLLEAWQKGDAEAGEALFPLVFDELRRLAAGYLHNERAGHTLEPTALVNEVYLRLVNHRNMDWKNRNHFFALAAKTMRRILIDHARRQHNQKRGGHLAKISLQDAGNLAMDTAPDLLALNEALEGLAEFDPRKASIVELRYFVGLSVQEIAEVVGCSTATVTRHWIGAKAWLYRELNQRGSA